MQHRFSNIYIPYINETFRLIVFIILSIILSELKSALNNHKRLARTDSLTDISNRRSFFELADMEIKKARRYRRSISLIYMDIDNFKQVNDTMGHHNGDALLREVAKTIKTHIRNIDIVARFGGDEFCVLMSRTEAAASYLVANKIREKLLSLADRNQWPVNFSLGLVTYDAVPDSVEQMVKTADALMYQTKKEGENKIVKAVVQAGCLEPVSNPSFRYCKGMDHLHLPSA